ncbi:phospholipid scramblase 1-like [Liolophura sinensis]|uniref:phospholipid scramblase 1-like n=1 Tax=Liolophura sinensis TaxID=3198878 RepID=UPI00315870C2
MSGFAVTKQPGGKEDDTGGIQFEMQENKRGDPFSFCDRLATPAGCQVLKDVNRLVIRQNIEEDIEGPCGSGSTFTIFNDGEDIMFYAGERSDCFSRWICGPHRQFSLSIWNVQEEEVLSLTHPCCRCDWCCCVDCFVCAHRLTISDRKNDQIGSIVQTFSCCQPMFEILDKTKEPIAIFKGPCCPCRCCTDMEFPIMDASDTKEMGYVMKRWGGERPDGINCDHEYYEIIFPPAMLSRDKALMLASSFLIHYMYFEIS